MLGSSDITYNEDNDDENKKVPHLSLPNQHNWGHNVHNCNAKKMRNGYEKEGKSRIRENSAMRKERVRPVRAKHRRAG